MEPKGSSKQPQPLKSSGNSEFESTNKSHMDTISTATEVIKMRSEGEHLEVHDHRVHSDVNSRRCTDITYEVKSRILKNKLKSLTTSAKAANTIQSSDEKNPGKIPMIKELSALSQTVKPYLHAI